MMKLGAMRFMYVTSWVISIGSLAKRIAIAIAEAVILTCVAVYYFAETIILTFTPGFLRNEKSVRGKVVLVTGGAGGVGQELVLRLARQDAKVVVWDINEKALEGVRERAKDEGHIIYTFAVDITSRDTVYKFAEKVKDAVGPVDILINNAGIVCGQTLLELPDYMIEKSFQVNVISNYWTVKAFLPDMLSRRSGHIVTVSSLTGLMGTYKCVDYSATKFATVGFHESLLLELKTHGHHFIKMTIVCPYFINTGMFDGCKPKAMPMYEPKDVAKRIITAIKRREVFVTIPNWARFATPLKYYIPAKLNWVLLYRVIKAPQSMMGMRSFKKTEKVEAA
ncbi:unnamed protein product [Acanthoscelides obtectus]|uniref:Short-chain dehydrogenase/reductase 3 n=1 Tax=Acanthoscelides obtectus TaxID=200917 RepID=A0A9P0JNF1_ACAOB|nr:unnamed protein product [Acanthoscelides obtectus]CAK1662179.1 Short-chain dehydrogenase/reductase family 16C member 6 [Acanthoscelides obtectus]